MPNDNDAFIDDLKIILEKHNVSNYILITLENGSTVFRTNNKDIMDVTKILRDAHGMCRNEVMKKMGEI